MKLVLGVIEQAYSDAKSGGAQTTGEVAEILEKKYHVMETYWELHQQEIAQWMADSIATAIIAITNGSVIDPFLNARNKIETGFRKFLQSREMEKIFGQLTGAEADYFMSKTGGFTGAASRGVSHRKKYPYAKRNSRPAFIDTGLYMASFRAEIEK